MSSNKILGLIFFIFLINFSAMSQSKQAAMSFREYVEMHIPSSEELEVFLHKNSWVQFDQDVGYVLGNFLPHDGIDDSYTISTTQANGSRTSFMYYEDSCRINTYGNSFTAGNQVSDGETWQEYLAAHLGEPIRNFGVGGFGVYQSYRRMIREEMTVHGSKYNILYIWGDDHFRSLLRSRYMITTSWNERQNAKEGIGTMFHGNFWSNLEMNLQTGTFQEQENLLPTPASLFKMTDADWMYEHLKDDWALQMRLFADGKIDSIDVEKMQRLSQILNVTPLPNENTQTWIEHLLNKYAFAATKYILQKAQNFAERNSKKLLIVLFDPYGATRELLEGKKRNDQEIVDYLEDNAFDYFDMNTVHLKDYLDFKLTIDQYFARYFIGHYNPSGNHFFAHAIKDKLVHWLDPKPFPYLNISGKSIDFKGYLKDYKSKE